MERSPSRIEKCVVLIKPDAQERKLVGKIIQRFEETGLRIAEIKNVYTNEGDLEEHYSHLDYDKIEEMVPYFIGDENIFIIAILFEGANAIAVCRKLIGVTEPFLAAPGTIRGDFGNESIAERLTRPKGKRSIRNLVHASDSSEAAEKEYVIWFCP